MFSILKHIIAILFICCLTDIKLTAQVDTVHLYMEASEENGQYFVYLKPDKELCVNSIQIAFRYNPAVLKETVIQSQFLPGLNSGHLQVLPGIIKVAYNTPNNVNLQIPANTNFFDIKFKLLQDVKSEVEFVNYAAFPFEVFCNGKRQEVILGSKIILPTNNGKISGKVKATANCSTDKAYRFHDWKIKLTHNSGKVEYVPVNTDGSYEDVVDTGSYTLKVISPTQIWNACDTALELQVKEINQVVQQDVTVNPTQDCPQLKVDVGIDRLRRCVNNTILVTYSNIGSAIALNAYVEIELDPYLIYKSSTVSAVTMGDNRYRFLLGDVEAGGQGNFTIIAELRCDNTILGQTHCVRSHIYPDNYCEDFNPLWDESSIQTTAECIGNSVIFKITNVGKDMQADATYSIIEDEIISVLKAKFKLSQAQSMEIPFLTNGKTARIITDPIPNHPGHRRPTYAIEACGRNQMGSFSTGYFNSTGEDDLDLFKDDECVQSRGSYDPNDKSAHPEGLRKEHIISGNEILKYKIRFQNTGNDTAFRVIIVDTLSEFLDINSFQAGTSSHRYKVDFDQDRVVKFNFDPIALPDSSTSRLGSQGFVEYEIGIKPNILFTYKIENTASIFFDFNDAIITNTVFHTVGDIYVLRNSATNNVSKLRSYPNPFFESIVFELDDQFAHDAIMRVYSSQGVLISTVQFDQNKIYLQGSALPYSGMFYYEIIQSGKRIESGKVVKK